MTRPWQELESGMLHFRNNSLPEVAENYLSELSLSRSKNTVNLYRGALHHFYRFIAQAKLELGQILPKNIEEFDEDLARHNLKFVTRRSNLHLVRQYLKWLEDRGSFIDGQVDQLFPHYNANHIHAQQAPLPELALKFLEVLGTTNKPTTVAGYRACLRSFYKLHWKTKKSPYKIDRTDVEALMLFLKERNIGVNQRFARLVNFRRYLDWLYDHKKLKTPPDNLITSTDFPKREQKLPRPFPVDVDIELQKRLWDKNDIDHLGLLLMRRTGLRCGELRNLTFDCVEHDLNGHYFLKVPLGKLNTERIFPLDQKTIDVVDKIKIIHSKRPKSIPRNLLISSPQGRKRSRSHFNPVLREITRDLAIPGKVTVHRLRHSFATSLLSAGMPITTLKILLGHRDIRMTLNYAAVTQETVRREYFTALSKIQSRYEVASYPLQVPDLKVGVMRAFYDVNGAIKKFSQEHPVDSPEKLKRLLYRLNVLRHDFSLCLRLPET